jgi:hypothetical protein
MFFSASTLQYEHVQGEKNWEMIRRLAAQRQVLWRQHALERMLERGITREQLFVALEQGEIIESYPDDRPFPSHLILHAGENPIHVVAAIDEKNSRCFIVTVYHPDFEHFEPDLKTRRKK